MYTVQFFNEKFKKLTAAENHKCMYAVQFFNKKFKKLTAAENHECTMYSFILEVSYFVGNSVEQIYHAENICKITFFINTLSEEFIEKKSKCQKSQIHFL